jgi:hypothetical protein
LAPRALEEIVRPRRLAGVGARPLNFTVRRPPMSADRAIGLLIGFIMIGLGVNGVLFGKVLTRRGRGSRPTYFSRDKEPIWFWITVCLWIGVGSFVAAVVLFPKVPV